MKLTSMSKVNAFIELLLNKGWTVKRNHKHVVLENPLGRKATIVKTCRDTGHCADNIVSMLRRMQREVEAYVSVTD